MDEKKKSKKTPLDEKELPLRSKSEGEPLLLPLCEIRERERESQQRERSKILKGVERVLCCCGL